MRRLTAVILIVTVLGLGSTAGADAPSNNTNPSDASANPQLVSIIGDIAVPFDIETDIQLQYQGYAVTQAAKVTRNHEQLYRLRVAPNDMPNNYDGFYLFYTMDWKPAGEEKLTPPPAPKAKPAAPEPRSPEPEQPPRHDENKPPENQDDKPRGNDDKPQAPVPIEPDTPPESEN
jgi:hypothetical protein